MCEYIWKLDYFEYVLMIPKDFTYLYNVLLQNPENSLSSNTIKKHLLLLLGLYPKEIINVYNKIIDIFTNKNNIFNELKRNDYYEYLALCFLKYGVDGIKPIVYQKCRICHLEKKESKEAKEDNEDDLKSTCVYYNKSHKFCSTSINSSFCLNCGKRITGDIFNTPSIGNCITLYNNHDWINTRKLICPYEEYCSTL